MVPASVINKTSIFGTFKSGIDSVGYRKVRPDAGLDDGKVNELVKY